MAASPSQVYDAAFDALLRAPAQTPGAGTAVPESAEEFNLTTPPRRTQMEEVDERFEKFNQTMKDWASEFEKRMLELIVAKVRPPPAPGFAATVDERASEGAKGVDPWAQSRAAVGAAAPPAAGAAAHQASGPGASAPAGLTQPWASTSAAPLQPIHPKDVSKPDKYGGVIQTIGCSGQSRSSSSWTARTSAGNCSSMR